MFLILYYNYVYYPQTFGNVCYVKQLWDRGSLRAAREENLFVLVRIKLVKKNTIGKE